ncbi:LytR family transcriptional regulator [Nocardioides marmoriginsengisoli]|uniref:LytR family transcriptional regulator n=1 Tax=Nocardioides marmoriginsengisoli TaxID=661483 RepID=A0A3N0CFQ7_9ACTN|nr:LytR C-terminal domain-containing protein [Nocardioides marmoriginsengisoli]RNL62129.1 LytR family transcriptional regulator [Nocardioides marmoriginsengisoli]
MSEADSRNVVSWATLAAMGLVTLVMAVWGFNSLTAPVEKDPVDEVSSGTDGSACEPGEQFVKRSDVTVSVYNAGKRTGHAQDTLDLLENAGFVAGAVGDAPKNSDVPKVQVRAKDVDSPTAKLVALAFGKHVPVTAADDELGPGVVVFIGDKFKRLDSGAPRKVKATGSDCSS